MTGAGTVALHRERRLRRTLAAYARLSNLKVYFQWIPAVAGWSLAPAPFDLPAEAWLALGLFIAGVIVTACSAGTLDDVQGFRDGIDQRTYAQDDALRGVPGKPLVTGEISEDAAHRFALACGAAGLVLPALAILVAPEAPLWLVAAWAAAWYVATQYSYGLKLSYHGAGELVLALEAATFLLFALVLVHGELSATAWFQAYLVGTLFAQVTVFSSTQDAAIDREFDRMTVAARLSPRGNARFIATVFAVGWAMTAAGFATGALDSWLLVALLPTWALQFGQLVQGLGHRRWLVARHLGWRAFDAGFLALFVVNFAAG